MTYVTRDHGVLSKWNLKYTASRWSLKVATSTGMVGVIVDVWQAWPLRVMGRLSVCDSRRVRYCWDVSGGETNSMPAGG
jgi:hypothetical protein